MKKLFLLKLWIAIVSALVFTALSLGWIYAHSARPTRASDADIIVTSAPGLISAPATDLADGDPSAALPNVLAVTPNFTITIQACQDGNLNGCEPGESLVPPPTGVSACLEGPGLPPNHCQPITSPAGVIFTNLVTGAYTASLRLDPALMAMDYELTAPQAVTVTLRGCQCDLECQPPACESICRCQCEATVKLGIVRRGLTMTKVDHPDPVIAGDRLTYTIALTNIGLTTVTNVVISDTLDPNVSFASASHGGTHDGQPFDGVVTWPVVSTLAPSNTITHALSVTVSDSPNACVLTNTVIATGRDESGATLAATATATTTVQPGIRVNVCQDQDADGDCGPFGPLPFTSTGILACLRNVSADLGCQPVGTVFTNALTAGVYTASLRFTGASQGYYPTLSSTTTTILAPCTSITLPVVNPVHPKGVAVHTNTNKVYVAFQGPVVFSGTTPTWPYPFVAVIDGETDQVLRAIPGGPSSIGREPWGVAASGNYVYVGSFGEGRVTVINPNSDTIITNLQPGGAFSPTAVAVNPINGWVHFADYRGGRVVMLNGPSLVATPTIINPPATLSPFELVVANSLQGYNFVTLRDALPPNRFKFAGLNSVAPFSPSYHDIVLNNPAGATGTPHAIGLWQATGQNRLFITYADDPRPPANVAFPNPNKLLVYSFAVSSPTTITKENEINLGRDYAEVGLIHNQQANHMLGAYAGFSYTVGFINNMTIDDTKACSNTLRGGTYALNFDGDVLGIADGADTANIWKWASRVVGNPPLIGNTLLYKNPFEIAINPNNGKIYVTDRCWNDWASFGGSDKLGSGAVLIFFDTNTSAATPNDGIMLPIILKGDEPDQE